MADVAESKPRKRVLTPPEKPEPKEGAFITPRGKELEIRHNKQYGLYFIVMTSGGVLPNELSGKFTSPSSASKAIEKYLVNRV